MTIDEAIEKYRCITNTDSCCPRYCMLPCEDCVQECKQVLEWLEELNILKLQNHLGRDEALNEEEKQIYNKAVDDFYNALADELTWLMNYGEEVYINVGDDANRIAEQLKEQTYE